MRLFHKILATVMITLAFAVVLLSNSAVVGASPGEVKVTTPFPRIQVNPGQDIVLTVTVSNLGSEYETLDLEVSELQDWQVTLKSSGYLVKMVTLAPFENQAIVLTAKPPIGVGLGSYTVEVNASDGAGNIKDSLEIVIDIAEVSPLGLSLSTASPSIEGPAGQDFTFTVELKNDTGEGRDIVLSAVNPTDWNVTFKQGYQGTLVRAVNIDSGGKSSLQVAVSPPSNVEAGEYHITVQATSGAYEKSLELGVVITGTYKLGLTTSDGLLNLSAPQGEKTPVTLVVTNNGSAALESMTFSSSKPSGWEVTFEPSNVPLVSAGSSGQVTANIKPASDAIPGDYSVIINANASPRATSARVELRVTVLGSILGGLVGIFLIVVVIAGMVFIFWRLGRR
ncbi:MAG: NEW3 domain-containing protein [Methanobacteriota archaeon]